MTDAKRRRQSRRFFIAQTVGTQATWSMADYDAKIRVSADTTDVDRKLSSLEKQLAQLNKKGGLTFDLKDSTKLNQIVTGFQNLQTRARAAGQDVLNLGNNFKNFGRLAATSGLGAAYLQINQLGVAASNAGSVFGPLNSLIKGFGAAAQAATPYGNAVIDAIKNIGITSGTTAAEIALATAAFMAFSPVLKRATVDTIEVAKAGITAGKAIGDLGKGAGVAALNAGLFITNKKLNEALEPAENLRKLFQRQLDTRTELEKRVSAMNIVLNQHNAFSATGLKILEKTLELEQRLTKELNNQQAARKFVDPGSARKLQIEQRIAAIRRGEIGGNEAFREYASRAAAISDAGTRDLYQRTAGVGKYAPKAPIANMPLALPSTELLDPVGRGIKRITEYSGEYTATLDKGVAAGQRFTQSLKQADTESLKLQGDLKALELVLSRVTNSLSNVGVRNQFAGKQVGPETRADYYQRIGVERKNAMMLADREAATEAKINAILEKRNTIRAKGGGFGKAASGALSNAAVGGAFPLLFGQSGTAAAGGAIGGVLGSVVPGIGGFGGSLIGTILGEKLGQGNQVKQLGEDIGFSAEQTKMLGTAFQQAGRDFDKFQQSVSTIQGLSLSIEDQAKAIQLASSLTETYKGKIDKVTNAFANALSTGKVTQGTLNKLTNEGIPIQQALADKYNVSRSAIIQMAKDGQISVQDLIDTLVEVGNEAQKVGAKQVDPFIAASEAIGTAATNLNTALAPAYAYVTAEVAKLIQKIADLTTGVANFIAYATPAIGTVVNAFNSINTAIGNAALNIPNLNASISNFAQAAYISLFPVAALVDHIVKQGKGPGFLGYGKYAAPSDQMRTPEPLKTFNAPSQAATSGSSAADKAAKAAEREAARVANIVRDRAAETEIIRMQMIFAEQITAAEIEKDPILKSQLQTIEKINTVSINYNKAINDEMAKGNSIAAKEAITKKALAEIEQVNFEGALETAKIEIDRAKNYESLLLDLDQELKLKAATTEQAREQLRIEYEMKKLKLGKEFTDPQLAEIQRRKQQLAAPKTAYETISGAAGAATDEFTKLINFGNQAITIADAIGTAFSTSFKGIISGTMSAQQALATFFQSVADAFLDMAAQIIAKWIQMTILNTILSLFPGGSKGSGGDLAKVNMVDVTKYSTPFAEGGFVTGPTNALIGEAGQPEYVIPASKMRESMNRYAAGARGPSVISGNDSSGATGGTVTMAPAAIDVRYTVERINSVDYVTADQFRSGMQQAAQQGATQGEQRTLRRLQMSATTRRKVGI